MKSVIFLLILSIILGCDYIENSSKEKEEFSDKIQKQFYVDDIETIEILTVNYCLDNEGNTIEVKLVPEKTTYKNLKVINEIINYCKMFKNQPNNCFDYSFDIVNLKYKDKVLEKDKFEKLENLKEGTFAYKSILNANGIVIRTNDYQLEKNGNWFAKYKIVWTSPEKYTLTLLDISENKSLIGTKISVEIIDILENGDYFFKSEILNRPWGMGVISRIK